MVKKSEWRPASANRRPIMGKFTTAATPAIPAAPNLRNSLLVTFFTFLSSIRNLVRSRAPGSTLAHVTYIGRASRDSRMPAHSRKGFLCLIKVPLRYSSKATFSSSWLFITMGPYQAIGSPMGLPETSRNLRRLSLALTETFSPSP